MPSIKNVVIFCGTHCVKDKEQHYFELAYRTGKLLAEAGFVVATGAGSGLMNETLRGAHEAGGQTIGVGLNISGRKHSVYASTIQVFDKLAERQEHLISIGDAFLALPGGVGTLYEIMQIMSFKRIAEIVMEKPMILIDKYFDPLKLLLDHMAAEGFADERVPGMYKLAATPEAAVALLRELK